MPVLIAFPKEQDRQIRTLRWEQEGPPRVEVILSVDLDNKTVSIVRMSIVGASGATITEAAQELAQVLTAVRQRVREKFGLA